MARHQQAEVESTACWRLQLPKGLKNYYFIQAFNAVYQPNTHGI